MLLTGWEGPRGEIGRYVTGESKRSLEAYRAQPSLVMEQANQEQDAARGGYANRQIIELIQNSADQIAKGGEGRIRIRLTKNHLYCADDGAPLDTEGARSLLFSHLSPKRRTDEIGRFGVGFKAVLGVSDRPAVFSRSGSIQFDRENAKRRIREVVPEARDCPVLRVADALDVDSARRSDPELQDLMKWATNIVRLPLKPGSVAKLTAQIEDFQSEFLLFVKHVESLEFVYRDSNSVRRSRIVKLTDHGGMLTLNDNDQVTRWTLFTREHKLTPGARADTRALDNADQIRIVWAAPRTTTRGRGEREIQQFWAYFPTQTSSLLRGILNAPWKTNEDRQSLLPGDYNNELIDAAAHLVADSLSHLRNSDSPARHLDYLPRREEPGDNEHATRLRKQLNAWLRYTAIVPDQNGALQEPKDISIPPAEVTPGRTVNQEILQHWSAYDSRPAHWLHSEALLSERLAAIFRIRDGGESLDGDRSRSGVGEWVRDLVEAGKAACDSVGASEAAVLTAAALRRQQTVSVSARAVVQEHIVLTGSGKWVQPMPDKVFFPTDNVDSPELSVHPALMENDAVVRALREFGIRSPSPEDALRRLASRLLDRSRSPSAAKGLGWAEFWDAVRAVSPPNALEIVECIDDWRFRVHAKAIDGTWQPLCFLIWPGRIVPDDGSRDGGIAVDDEFHVHDKEHLNCLGVYDAPVDRWSFNYYWGDSGPLNETLQRASDWYYERPNLPTRNPQRANFDFHCEADTPGPVEAFSRLSEQGRAQLTAELLDLPSSYYSWFAWHRTQNQNYPKYEYRSPIVELIRSFGRVQIGDVVLPFADGLGEVPESTEVREWLLSHPRVEDIRSNFDLPEHLIETYLAIGEEDPLPLLDAWPGLVWHVGLEHRGHELVRCESLRKATGERSDRRAWVHQGQLFVCRAEESEELAAAGRALGLVLTQRQIDDILNYQTPEEIEAARAHVRRQSTNAAKLLAAVGELALRARLPATLIDVLSLDEQPFVGERVAEAAIAVYHTGVLKEYKDSLVRLGPPSQWAGRRLAVEFVRDLGFPDEWAGSPRLKRASFEDVIGPRTLPDLHGYQEVAVGNVRRLLRAKQIGGENRGLLSLPTGSGKTRVAVQAIVEAMRDDGFAGSILWVADRDELCEQAIESWSHAWRSIGPEDQSLRIARMWAGQRPEFKRNGPQVVVATIQTLERRGDELEEIELLVIDEAHSSIAPTYTRLMSGLGLTFRRNEDEIPLLGLTATPYRGRDEVDTDRLVNRYGRNRLDNGAFRSDDPQDVIRELQGMKVLAEAEHDVIAGMTITLTGSEQIQAKAQPWLPDSVEERIAASAERTRSIVDSYLRLVRDVSPDWPTLIFATSVDHAKTVAAMLELEGVSARAVSGETDNAVRRSAVEEFRSGRLQVLVNYGVFREGFDAPKTRVIIVARPVYSPNLYFQMIGRGLRGVKNGGSDRCLIIDVADNIVNYDRQLAYTELEGLWQ